MASAATLGASTLEGQLLETVELIAAAQVDANRNPDGITIVNAYSRNMANGSTSVTLTIPTTDSLTTGTIGVSAAEVYTD